MAPRGHAWLVVLLCFANGACSWMPRELNLTPIWFHRLDADGRMLEWDAAWPILHYERTPGGGDDFRIRPLYRRVTEPSDDLPSDSAVEHQFLSPLGRVRSYPDDTSARLFPLWSWRERINEEGHRDVDWYLLFPFLWGGTSADGENYFAFLPFFADIPQFLTYDRFVTLLFPLYLGLWKNHHRHHQVLWPLIGFSDCDKGHSWFRLLPFYGHDIQPGEHDRRYLLWPFLAWSSENEDSKDGAVHSFWLWPLFGWRYGGKASGWMALWPFFQYTAKEGVFWRLTMFWPFFRYYWNRLEDNIEQWWLWPLVSRVDTEDQDAWTFLWPLLWFRHYTDPEGYNSQQWVLPFFWRIYKKRASGEGETHVRLFPLVHHTEHTDADGRAERGDWSVPSPFPWRDGYATGIEEAYGWLWQFVRGVRRGPDDDALDVVGRVYTERTRADGATASVPFLFNYERDREGKRTLRLLQFLPISLGADE